MIELNSVAILHTPKCAGTWLFNLLPGLCDVKERHAVPHMNLKEARELTDKPIVAAVRHPETWWPSYWNHRMRHGWQPHTHIVDTLANKSFTAFMRGVNENYPGFFSHYVQGWVGGPEEPVEHTIRYEYLVDDLTEVLDLYGEEYDVREFNRPRVNCSDYGTHSAIWGDQREAPIENERLVLQRFYS